MAMLPDLQLLPPDKERDKDADNIVTHLETLLLLTTTRQGRERLRKVGVYPIVREVHLHVGDEAVREAAERLVQVLMRDETDEEGGGGVGKTGEIMKVPAHEDAINEDNEIVEVF